MDAASLPLKKKSPRFRTALGYATDTYREKYISREIKAKRLPENAHRIAALVSLDAAADGDTAPLRFWQLFNVMGEKRIVAIVRNFYERVFSDPEEWFRRPFSDVAGIDHHVSTQSGMWCDVMGGGRYYHGGSYRLNFHHTHNAIKILNRKGAERWAGHMNATLAGLTDVAPQVRECLVEFMRFFIDDYGNEFRFDAKNLFP